MDKILKNDIGDSSSDQISKMLNNNDTEHLSNYKDVKQ